MKRIFSALVMTIAGFAYAQQNPTVPVDREHPLMTSNEVVQWGNDPNATWTNGYAAGHVRAVAKTLHLLHAFGLSTVPVCLPSSITNGQLDQQILTQMQSVTIPAAGNGNAQDWDLPAIINIAVATLQKFPCR